MATVPVPVAEEDRAANVALRAAFAWVVTAAPAAERFAIDEGCEGCLMAESVATKCLVLSLNQRDGHAVPPVAVWRLFAGKPLEAQPRTTPR